MQIAHALKTIFNDNLTNWACGAMDNASDYGSEDSRFDSWQARIFFLCILLHLSTVICVLLLKKPIDLNFSVYCS